MANSDQADSRIEVFHGDHLAFWLLSAPVRVGIVTSEIVLWPCGRPALNGEPLRCGNCGLPATRWDWNSAVVQAVENWYDRTVN